jgi:hypothetical protein
LESHASTVALEEGFRSQSGPEFAFLIVLAILGVICAATTTLWLAGGRSGPLIVPGLVFAAGVLLLFAIQGIFATPGTEDYFIIFGALALFTWVGSARVIRSQVLALRETEYVIAARAMGGSTARILWSHLLPNVTPIIIVGVSAGLGAIAGAEIALIPGNRRDRADSELRSAYIRGVLHSDVDKSRPPPVGAGDRRGNGHVRFQSARRCAERRVDTTGTVAAPL